jgi:hypothetical protein
MTASNDAGVVEGLRGQRIEPRMRLFFIDQYTKDTTLTLNDLYTHGKSADVVEKRLIKTQMRRLQLRLDDLNKKTSGKKKKGKYSCCLTIP